MAFLANAPQVMWANLRREFGYYNHLKQMVDLAMNIQITVNLDEAANAAAGNAVEAISTQMANLTTRVLELRQKIQQYLSGASSSSNVTTFEADSKELNELETQIQELTPQRLVAIANQATTLARLQASQMALDDLNLAFVNDEVARVWDGLEPRLIAYETPHWITVLDTGDMTALVMKRHLGGGELLFAVGTSVKASMLHYLATIAQNQLGIEGLSSEILYSINGDQVGPADEEAINRVGFVPPAQRYIYF